MGLIVGLCFPYQVIIKSLDMLTTIKRIHANVLLMGIELKRVYHLGFKYFIRHLFKL